MKDLIQWLADLDDKQLEYFEKHYKMNCSTLKFNIQFLKKEVSRLKREKDDN